MDDLDPMLTQRHITPPRPGFEQRILAAARAQPQLTRLSPMAWLRRAMGELPLPTPQLTFTLMLLAGMVIGFSAAQAPSHYGASAVDTYLSDDGAIL